LHDNSSAIPRDDRVTVSLIKTVTARSAAMSTQLESACDRSRFFWVLIGELSSASQGFAPWSKASSPPLCPLVVWSTPIDKRRKRRCRAVQSQAMFGGYWLLFLRFERSFVLGIVGQHHRQNRQETDGKKHCNNSKSFCLFSIYCNAMILIVSWVG
jgi:hypothetical protein